MTGQEVELHPRTAGRTGYWVRACLLGAVILICGMVIGGALAYRFFPVFGIFPAFGPGMHPDPDRMVEWITERLRGELDLSDEQAAAVRTIFREDHGRMEAVRLKVEPEVSAILQDTHAKVSQILNESQKVLWDKRFAEMRERMPFRPPPDPEPQPNSGPDHH